MSAIKHYTNTLKTKCTNDSFSLLQVTIHSYNMPHIHSQTFLHLTPRFFGPAPPIPCRCVLRLSACLLVVCPTGRWNERECRYRVVVLQRGILNLSLLSVCLLSKFRSRHRYIEHYIIDTNVKDVLLIHRVNGILLASKGQHCNYVGL